MIDSLGIGVGYGGRKAGVGVKELHLTIKVTQELTGHFIIRKYPFYL